VQTTVARGGDEGIVQRVRRARPPLSATGVPLPLSYRVVKENAGRQALAARSEETIARVAGDRLSV
jgi:hypothetical protein